MSGSIPAGLKPVKTFLMRAQELDKAAGKSPNVDLIAYCCRRFALQKSFADPEIKSQEGVEAYLMKLMDRLEVDNPKLKQTYGEELMKNKDAQLEIVKNFALGIFKGADDTYKAGKATKNTAKTFYAAAAYFEVAGDDEELVTSRKVSKLNAMNILNAIKEGRTPLPPQPEPVENDDDGFEGGDDIPTATAASYGFDATLPSVPDGNPDSLFDLPAAPTNVDEEDDHKPEEEERRPIDPRLPPGTYVRQISTFEDVNPRLGALPVNAQLSVRGKEMIRASAPVNVSAQAFGKKDAECSQAEQLTRAAANAFKKNDYFAGIDYICKSLEVLEKRKPYGQVPASGLAQSAQLDTVEYLLFAARTLECAGEFLPVQEAKLKARDLLSNALRTAQRG